MVLEIIYNLTQRIGSLISPVVAPVPGLDRDNYILHWPPSPHNPLLPLGDHGSWDEISATWASVVHDGRAWRMYYSGKDSAQNLRIGVAFSDDGLQWTKYQDNPLLTGEPQAWDDCYVYLPIVWHEDHTWHMLYTGCNSITQHHFQIGLAHSDDGLHWNKAHQNPVFCDPRAETINNYGNPETEGWGILRTDNGYYLLYNTVTRKPRQIYCAFSSDLYSWKSLFSQPVLPSTGRRHHLGYMKYCAYPFQWKHQYYIVSAVSDAWYWRSAIGLWLLPSLTAPATRFLGYILAPQHSWCRQEVDTPYILPRPDQSQLQLYFSGRSWKNQWMEGVAMCNLDEFPPVDPRARSLQSSQCRYRGMRTKKDNGSSQEK